MNEKVKLFSEDKLFIHKTKFINHYLRFNSMELSVENYNAKLDEILKRVEHVESLLLMGEAFPGDKEISIIKDYLSRTGCGETEFITLEEIDNEL